jgi:hypothetical protein
MVEHREVETVDVGYVAQLLPRNVSGTRPLDFDYVGTKPRQQLGTGRTRLNVCEIEDSHPV